MTFFQKCLLAILIVVLTALLTVVFQPLLGEWLKAGGAAILIVAGSYNTVRFLQR